MTAALASDRRALLEALLRERRRGGARIPRRADAQPAPLSFSQQRIWFLQQWEPSAPTFNAARAVRIEGGLDVDALRKAFETVITRHEALRTTFQVVDREPRQVVLERWSFALPIVELTRDGLEDALRAASRRPYDLTLDLMIRATLFRLAPHDHILLVGMHHIAGDAFSVGVLAAELAEAYDAALSGRSPDLPELPIQYADFAVWQRQRLTGETLDELLRYWTAELRGAPPLLDLPLDRPRRPVQRHEGAHLALELPKELADGVRALARETASTVYMVLLGAFATVLYRLSGSDDVVVGTPIAGRTNGELTGLIGFFANTIALRVRLQGNPSFRELCARVKTAALGSYRHQELPFDRVVDALEVRRDPSYSPIFQVNFRAEEATRPTFSLTGTTTSPISVDIGFSRFDLALELHVEADRIGGYWEYDRDLFDESTVGDFAEDFEALLRQVVTAPDTPLLELSLPHGRRPAQPPRGPAPLPRRRQPTSIPTDRGET
jgi:hypothetical protein